MIMRGHMQNAYVTHDLERAMEIVGDKLRIEKFDRYYPDMTVRTPLGEKHMKVLVGSAWSGGMNIELIQPVAGYVDHYVTMLPEDRSDPTPRFHHVSLRRDDEEAMRAEIDALGFPLAFEGPASMTAVPISGVTFVYLDAREILGHYVEFTWKSAEAWKFLGWPEGRQVY